MEVGSQKFLKKGNKKQDSGFKRVTDLSECRKKTPLTPASAPFDSAQGPDGSGLSTGLKREIKSSLKLVLPVAHCLLP